MTSNRIFPIFELSSQDFERLCLDLLNAEGVALVLHPDSPDSLCEQFYISGEKPSPEGKPKKIAIEVKHRKGYSPVELMRFVERIYRSVLAFDEYMFITSSPLTTEQLQAIQYEIAKSGLNIKLFSQKEIFDLLTKHPKIAAKYFKSVTNKITKLRIETTLSLIVLFLSVFGAFMSISSIFPFTKDKDYDYFQSQIQAVELNLESLKVLERSLSALKKELQVTSNESVRIKMEYEESLKLKTITAEQLKQIKKAVNAQSAIDTFWHYFFGFLIGVTGSILATIIVDRWKARRALSGP